VVIQPLDLRCDKATDTAAAAAAAAAAAHSNNIPGGSATHNDVNQRDEREFSFFRVTASHPINVANGVPA
jgi:hypothetical protein